MATYDRYGAARKKKKRSLFAPITILLVIVAIVFSMGVFFRVQTIEVRGAVSYTEEEIIEASGIDIGDNLFFGHTSASSRIFSKLPLVDGAHIDISYPNKIIITVEESFPLAYVDWEGQYWTMTGSCKLLGSTFDEGLEGLIHVIGVIPVGPNAGEAMMVAADDSLKLTYLQELLPNMQHLGMIADVRDLNMENPANPTFTYLGRFVVRMGQNDNTEYKLRMLLSAVQEIDQEMGADFAATIDLSEGTALHVIQD